VAPAETFTNYLSCDTAQLTCPTYTSLKATAESSQCYFSYLALQYQQSFFAVRQRIASWSPSCPGNKNKIN